MSSPIPIPARNDASSLPLYVPVHRRTPGSYTSSSSSRTPSPSPTLAPTRGIYTPAELLLLSTSPLAKLSAEHIDALRALTPEVVQTRKQRKALVWHARHPPPTDVPRSHKRTSSNSRGSESEEDRATTWRRT